MEWLPYTTGSGLWGHDFGWGVVALHHGVWTPGLYWLVAWLPKATGSGLRGYDIGWWGGCPTPQGLDSVGAMLVARVVAQHYIV